MVRMMTYKDANRILSSSLTPNNRCICKRTAIENDAQSDPLAPFTNNRLVPVSKVIKNESIIQYHIVFQDENGDTIPGYDIYLNQGERIVPPQHPTKEGYKADGWEPEVPATAQSDGTYRMKYKQKDDDAPGRENYAYTMDNQYQQYAPNKPTPPSPLGDESKGWRPTGGGWWFGPMDGENEDTHGKDGGISASTISGRTNVTVGSTRYFTYDTLLDGCVYEYARPGSLPDSSATVTASDLLSDWSCPCYDGSGNLMGNYTIHSDCDWVKFVVVSVGYSINDITPPFAVRYFIAENTGNVRKGSVTVTTPGGVSHYDANHSHKGLPYITNAPTYFYQLGAWVFPGTFPVTLS